MRRCLVPSRARDALDERSLILWDVVPVLCRSLFGFFVLGVSLPRIFPSSFVRFVRMGLSVCEQVGLVRLAGFLFLALPCPVLNDP